MVHRQAPELDVGLEPEREAERADDEPEAEQDVSGQPHHLLGAEIRECEGRLTTEMYLLTST